MRRTHNHSRTLTQAVALRAIHRLAGPKPHTGVRPHAHHLAIPLAAALLPISGMVTVAAVPPVSHGVLFVVAAPSSLTAGEQAVSGRLTSHGYTVTTADDDTVTPAQAAGTSLVLISQSASSTAAAVKSLAAVTVPVWVAKPWLFPVFGLTGTAGTDYGVKAGSQLTVTAAGHPMAAGRTGTIVLQSGGQLSYGRPAAAATVVAVNGSDPVAFTLAAGNLLASGSVAPGCRLTFPLYANAPVTFTADAWAMFDATTAWATAGCTTGPPPIDQPPTVAVTAPQAGATVSGPQTLTATASDDLGVRTVEFAIDGTPVGSDATSPYAVAWDASTASAGPHTVTATATDTGGQTASDTVSFTVAAVAAAGESQRVVRGRRTVVADRR